MAPTTFTTLALAGLSLQASAYTLTAYKNKGCTGEVQQTIEDTKYGAFCNYFNDKAASISVSGGDDSWQWIFFNNYPCSSDTQVGSFIGNQCIDQGETKLKAVTNILVESTKKRDVPEALQVKRERAGIIRSWENGDCSGASTNELAFINENLPVTLNNVGSAMVMDVKDGDIAFACTDNDCHVDNQVAMLPNNECVNLEGKGVRSAMVIGVPTPPKRSLTLEAREMTKVVRANENIHCTSDNQGGYKDALRTGDDWQGDNGLACCCHIPGGPNSKSDGSAKASISDNIRCPADPSGTKPPPSTCPLNCNEMRSYVYAIATKCKDGDNTGGYADLGAGQTITVGHS